MIFTAAHDEAHYYRLVVVLGARVVQSLVHVASRSEAAVRVRALMQVMQMACFIWLGASALRAAFAPA